MRGLSKLAAGAVPGRSFTTPAFTAAHTFSSFSGGGRGRGRGSAPPPPRVPGQPLPAADDSPSPPGQGHGRGIGRPAPPPSSPDLNWSSAPPISLGRGQPHSPPPPPPASPSLGRGQHPPPPPASPSLGRGQPQSPPPAPASQSLGCGQPQPQPPPLPPASPSLGRGQPQPTPSPPAASAGIGRGQPQPTPAPPAASAGIGRDQPHPIPSPPPPAADPQPKKPIFFTRDSPLASPPLPGFGRGKPAKYPAPNPKEENRHIRARPPPPPRAPISADQRGGRGGRGGGGRGERGRGRGRNFQPREERTQEPPADYLGDDKDGERLKQRLGEENMKELEAAFEEACTRALPSPLDDAYLDALHTNMLIETEAEYMVNFDNPDIDEKEPMPLMEVLRKAKPFLIAYNGIQSEEEWQDAITDLKQRLPHLKNLINMYCGPNIVTAKQQQKMLEKVAKTIPENVHPAVRRFADRAVLSLQSNPGWAWGRKNKFMHNLAEKVTKHYS